MFFQPDLFDTPAPELPGANALDLPMVIARISDLSARPRYAFMVLNLIARAAAANGGRAGPHVLEGRRRIPLRDWLADALIPMAKRDGRRMAIVDGVRAEMALSQRLPEDPGEAERHIEAEVRARVRPAGRCNVSRAVSDLVRAGLVRRYYQGYRVDHHNRGAQREAVYVLTEAAAGALGCAAHAIR